MNAQLCILVFSIYSFTFSLEPACPQGFVKKEGDLSGMGLYHAHKVSSVQQCADDSTKILLSKAFMYSETSGLCKLLAHPNPDAPKYGDYIFCQKLGTNFNSYLVLGTHF